MNTLNAAVSSVSQEVCVRKSWRKVLWIMRSVVRWYRVNKVEGDLSIKHLGLVGIEAVLSSQKENLEALCYK